MTDKERIAELESRVAGLTALIEHAKSYRDRLLEVGYKSFKSDADRASFYNDGLKALSVILNTPIEPLLAAHDAAKQAELIEALRNYGDAAGMSKRPLDFIKRLAAQPEDTSGRDLAVAEIAARAILAKYPKAAKEDA